MEGSVYQRKGRTTWTIRYDLPSSDGKRNRREKGGYPSEPAAKKALRQILHAIENGESEPSNITLHDFLDIWMNDHVKATLSPKVIASYTVFTDKYFKIYFNSKLKLKDVRANNIERFYNDLRKNRPDLDVNTIYALHKVLLAAFSKAVRWDYIDINPFSKVTPPKKETREAEYWAMDELDQGIALYKDSEIYFYVQIAVETGLRIGEVCALKVSDVDFKNMTFKVSETLQQASGQIIFKTPKTESSIRVIPMTKAVSEIFNRRIIDIKKQKMAFGKKYNKAYEGYLSVKPNGDLILPGKVGITFTRILQAHNKNIAALDLDEIEKQLRSITPISFHGLRHSCGTWLILNGTPINVVQKILGHSDPATTARIYAHVNLDDKRRHIDRNASNKY